MMASTPLVRLLAALCLAACSDGGEALDELRELASDGGQAAALDAAQDERDAAPRSEPVVDAQRADSLDAQDMSNDAGPAPDAAPLDASTRRDAATADARIASPASADAGKRDASAADAAAGPTVPCDLKPGYASFGRAFIETYCSACHGFKNEPLFTSLEKIEPYASEIIERVLYEMVDALHMPPYGRPQPSQSERQKLEAWLSCGAL